MHTKFWTFLGLHFYMATKKLTKQLPRFRQSMQLPVSETVTSFSSPRLRINIHCPLIFYQATDHTHTHIHTPPQGPLSLHRPAGGGEGLPSGSLDLPVSGPNPTPRSHDPPTKPITSLLYVHSQALANGTAERNQKAPSRGLGNELQRNLLYLYFPFCHQLTSSR